MSHRVTTQTDIKDKALALEALKASGAAFTDRGQTIDITSGPMKGANIDLRTGAIGGSWDVGLRQSDDSIGFIKRFYAEAKIKQECHLRGVIIEDRKMNKDGTIELIVQGSFA